MSGKLEFLYDAILSQLTDLLAKEFNTALQPVLADALVGMANSELDKMDVWSLTNMANLNVD